VVVKNFDTDVFALIQGVYAGKKDKNAKQQAVREPTPDKRMVKDIPGGYISGGNNHDYKNQIAENPAGFFNHFINPTKEFIDNLAHCNRPLFG
jgi:hypothetical protein